MDKLYFCDMDKLYFCDSHACDDPEESRELAFMNKTVDMEHER